MRIEKIEANLAKAEQAYHDWRKAVEVYERCKGESIGTFPESAYRAYIVTGSTADAAQALNIAGQRKDGKKFKPEDISAAIDDIKIEDTELAVVAKFLLRNGRIHINQLFN